MAERHELPTNQSHRRLLACSSGIEHDADFEECAGWCSRDSSDSHCPWCKCRSCEFCRDLVAPAVQAPSSVPHSLSTRPPRGCPVGSSSGPLRLSACGAELIPSGGRLANGGPGRPLILSGVNMYIQYYMELPSAWHDIRWLRESIPSANVIRLVGILWHDSTGPEDGLECFTNNANWGYMNTRCVHALDKIIAEATAAGLWVILTARAKYAAGWGWPGEPDVWHSPELVQKYYAMWSWMAERYSTWERIAGYEIMSEPRTKDAAPERVASFMRGGCDAVHRGDRRALCVVGPAPYYKAWNFDERVILDRDNVLYTYDFFVPWKLVTANTGTGSDARFPGTFPCKDVYDTWWPNYCDDAHQSVRVDASWIKKTTREVPYELSRRFNVPVFCNQWGVKNELYRDHGRLQYAKSLLESFVQLNISSTYWIWRSYPKDDRPLDQPVWGFELVHNSGPRQQPVKWVHDNLDTLESLDAEMAGVLRSGFPVFEEIPTEPKPPPPLPPFPPPSAPADTPLPPPQMPCSHLDPMSFIKSRQTHLTGAKDQQWCNSIANQAEYDPDLEYSCHSAWVDPTSAGSPIDYQHDCTLGCALCRYLQQSGNRWSCVAEHDILYSCPAPAPALFINQTRTTVPLLPPLATRVNHPPASPRWPLRFVTAHASSSEHISMSDLLSKPEVWISLGLAALVCAGAVLRWICCGWRLWFTSTSGDAVKEPRSICASPLDTAHASPSSSQCATCGKKTDHQRLKRPVRPNRKRGGSGGYAQQLDEATTLELQASHMTSVNVQVREAVQDSRRDRGHPCGGNQKYPPLGSRRVSAGHLHCWDQDVQPTSREAGMESVPSPRQAQTWGTRPVDSPEASSRPSTLGKGEASQIDDDEWEL